MSFYPYYMRQTQQGPTTSVSYDPVSGQTLLAREWYDTTITNSNKGIFTGGSVTGQVTAINDQRGPYVAVEHTTRRSGGLQLYTDAEEATPTTLFKGIVKSGYTSTKVGEWHFFGRGRTHTDGSYVKVIQFAPAAYTEVAWLCYTYDAATDTASIRHIDSNGTAIATATIYPDSWTWIEMFSRPSGADLAVTCAYRKLGDSANTLLGTSTIANWAVNLSAANDAYWFWHTNINMSNNAAGSHNGRRAATSVYRITDSAVGNTYPAEVRVPVVARKAFACDGEDGDDADLTNVQTPAGVASAIRNSVYLGAYQSWKTVSGTNNMFTDMANVAAQKSANVSYRISSDYLVPQGDTLEFKYASGTYYFLTSELNFLYAAGIDVFGEEGQTVNIFLDKVLDSPVWTNDSNDVWYTADTGLALAGTDLLYSEDGGITWKAMCPIFAANSAAAITALDAQGAVPSFWSKEAATGSIYIQFRDGDPNNFTWRVIGDHLTSDAIHGFQVGDGRIRNLTVRGGRQFDATANNGSMIPHYLIKSADAVRPYLLVVDNCVGKEFGKHSIGVSTNTPKAMVILKDCTGMNGPNNISSVFWSTFVIHSGAPTRSADGQGLSAFMDEEIDRPNLSVPGSSDGVYDAAYSSLQVHNSTGVNQICFAGLYGCDFTAGDQTDYFDGNVAVQAYEVGA